MHRNSFVALGPISMKSQSDRSFGDDAKQDIKKLFDHFSRLHVLYSLADGGLGKEELVPANEGKRKWAQTNQVLHFFQVQVFICSETLSFLRRGMSQ